MRELACPVTVVLVLLGCGTAPVSAPTFTVDSVTSTWEVTDYSYRQTTSAVLRGSDAGGAYMVVLEVARLTRPDPAQKPDTIPYLGVMVDGRMPITMAEFVSRCREYSLTDCVGSQPADPQVQFRIIGWTRLTKYGE